MCCLCGFYKTSWSASLTLSAACTTNCSSPTQGAPVLRGGRERLLCSSSRPVTFGGDSARHPASLTLPGGESACQVHTTCVRLPAATRTLHLSAVDSDESVCAIIRASDRWGPLRVLSGYYFLAEQQLEQACHPVPFKVELCTY